jgi:hypothetical protein
MAEERPTDPIVTDDESLNRWFSSDDVDDRGQVHVAKFRTHELSVFREKYLPWREHAPDGVAQLLASSVRAIDNLDVRPNEPPPAHAVVFRTDCLGQRLSMSQARRLRDAAVVVRPAR